MLGLHPGSRRFESFCPYHYFKEDQSHGEAKTNNKRRFHIIEYGTYYKVKKRFGPFWFYVRKGFKKRIFTDFGDVVNFVHKK